MFLFLPFLVFLCKSASASNDLLPDGTMCIMTHCLVEVLQCELDKQCAGVLKCITSCPEGDTGCTYECGVNDNAGENPHYLNLLRCMVKNSCLPRYPDSGVCLAEDNQALPISDYSLISGDWWPVYGQSCGQTTDDGVVWDGAYDWSPCMHIRYIQRENGDWINNSTFCHGQDSVCESDDIMNTVPDADWLSPGVLRNDYPQSEAPIVPEIEDWKWMWMNDDWAFVIWCGSNPLLNYNGAFVLKRTRSDGTIPAEIKIQLTVELSRFGLSLETMCMTDSTGCAV